MTISRIEIRPVETLEECRHVQQIQQAAWGAADIDVIPIHVLITMARNDAILLGAWNGPEMIGFTFGWLADRPGLLDQSLGDRLKYCSHETAVIPERQHQNIGFQLKCAQRDFALARGVPLITWTFDPLEGRNARLNFGKLGVTCRTFVPNLYGQMVDALNAGLQSDRMQVDWWLESTRVVDRLSGRDRPPTPAEALASGAALLNPWPPGNLFPAERLEPLSDGAALLEIPMDFQAIKRTNMDAARAWRKHLRVALEAFLASGYQAIEFLYGPVDDRVRSFYLLERIS